MAGRKKIPTKLKLLKGTQRADRLNPNEPDPDVNIPEPPGFLNKAASQEWERMSGILYGIGLLSDMDMAALALYCQSWGKIVEFEEILIKEGKTYIAANGDIRTSPYVSMLNKSYEYVYKFLTEFGMSPASRSKVSAKKKKTTKDPFAQFG